MVIRGRVRNGVVVVEDASLLPEGAEVIVEVRTVGAADVAMSAEKQERLREAFRRFQSLPNENPGDTFSGADHDRALYGDS